MPATLHLICGLPCSGKSTYAHALRDRRNAVLLSLDRWLIKSFGRYPVDTVGHEEHLRRVYANRELIWEVAAEFLHRGTDVILDDGFFLRADRADYASRAAAAEATTTIHFLDTPAEEVRKRVEIRNRSLDEFQFEIAPDALDVYISIFEKPQPDEPATIVAATAD